MQQTFSIKAILNEATTLMKPHRWAAIGQYALISIGLSIAFSLLFGKGAFIGSFISSFILVKWTLSYIKTGDFSFDQIFDGVSFKHFIYFIFASLLVLLSVFGGMLLLIIPGIIFAVRLMFVTYIAAEKQMAPMEALRESKRITKGYRWKIFGFLLVLGLINILGFLCLIVGVLYTAPLTAIATGLLYKKLSSQTEAEPIVEVVEVDIIETTA